MISVLWAFGAAVAWGASDYLGGITTRVLPVWLVLAVSQTAGLLVTSGLLLGTDAVLPTGWRFAAAVGAGVSAVLALGMLYVALAIGRSALVGPLAASGVSVPVSVGLIRGNRLTSLTTCGMVLAGIGLLCSNWESSETGAEPEGLRRPAAKRRVVSLSIGAALMTGLYLTLIGVASVHTPLGAIEILKLTASVIAIPILASRLRLRGSRQGSRASRSIWLAVAAVGATDGLAEIAFAASTVHGSLSVVALTSGLYPAVTIALFVFVNRERASAVQAVGAATAVAGLSLLVAGAQP